MARSSQSISFAAYPELVEARHAPLRRPVALFWGTGIDRSHSYHDGPGHLINAKRYESVVVSRRNRICEDACVRRLEKG